MRMQNGSRNPNKDHKKKEKAMRNVSKEMSQVLDERIVSKMKCKCLNLLVIAALAALLCPPLASALPILGPDLASFTVLGASTVTNVPTSTIGGNVGVWSSGGANAITGFNSTPGAAASDLQVTGGQVHAGTAVAQLAQAQLTNAITNLGLLGPGTLLAANLSGLTLIPGVYTVPAGLAGGSNLTGTLTLDGQGNANAAWVFQMESSLITSPNSVVNMIRPGSGAGVFWNVRSSATIDTNTTFLGNILALASITMNTTATDLCGRALASTGQVALDHNSLSGACTDSLAGSNGLSGGLDVTTTSDGVTEVKFLSSAPTVPAPVPEPSTMLLLGSGLAGLVVFRKRSKKA
jgi:ice-binding like protein/PEP-CTERM motif-containing protein